MPKSNNNQLQQVIQQFYQTDIPANRAAYYVTNPYFALLKARAKAEADDRIWQTILNQLKQSLPDYAIRDFSNLVDNSCYEGEILLHKKVDFMDDDEILLTTVGGYRFLLRLLVSVLGPFYHFYIEKMCYDETEDSYRFQNIVPTSAEQKQVAQTVQSVVEAHQYQWLDEASLTEIVPQLSTPFHQAGEVSRFHCLFSEFTGVY